MEEQVDQIVEGFRGALHAGTADGQSFQKSVEALQALLPVTEMDRMHHLLGAVRLLDVLLEYAPAEGNEPLHEQRAQIAELLTRHYGSTETPYVRSRSVVDDVAARLVAGEDSAETIDDAVEKLRTLDFDEADESARTTATLAVQSLRAAHDWLAAYDANPHKLAPVPFSLRMLATTLEIGGFDRDPVLAAAQTIREGRLSLDGVENGHALALMVVVGLGLRANSAALPGLDDALTLMAEALSEIEAGDATETPSVEPVTTAFAARCDAVLADFDRDLQRDGFSEYVMYQAMAGLKELETETEEDARSVRAALLRMIDMAVPHAPPEAAQTLLVTRDSIIAQDAPPQPPLDTAGIEAEGKAIVQRLRDELAAGGLASPATMRAITGLQVLAARVHESDEEAMKVLMRLMLHDVVAIAAEYAPADKATMAGDTVDMVRNLVGTLDGVLDEDPARAEIARQDGLREVTRFGQTPTSDPFEQPDALPHQRQFASLLRPLMERMSALRSLGEAGERDVAEANRIADRGDIALQRLRAATTGAQWIEHQRGSLRRAMVDLRRFERRHHLMVIEPPWSTSPVTVDANAVFFSGGEQAQEAAAAACGHLGMDAPFAHGVDDATHTRWNLLRRSAVAVFDFTAYDRVSADPPGALPRSPNARAVIAHAAAPVARVAYECGWALVLGMPIVTLARPGQALPFDIDIEPVPLHGDAEDPMRVALALQAAVLGVQRGLGTDDLGATVDRLRQRFESDSKSAPLLAALDGSRDAMQVQLAAEALLEHRAGRGAMLTLPAFPPHYPGTDGRSTLFHVTAFRPWSKPCEEAVRAVCKSAGLEYRIGYEHLDPDILRAIWQEIAAASFVVADLTNLNPNAALELAIAQALGRPTIVLSQTPDVHVHLPALAKVRVHTYAGATSGRKPLTQLVQRFVGGDA